MCLTPPERTSGETVATTQPWSRPYVITSVALPAQHQLFLTLERTHSEDQTSNFAA